MAHQTKDNLKVWCLNMKYFSRYKAKSPDNEIRVTMTNIYFLVKLWVIRTNNLKVWCLYMEIVFKI